MRSVPAALIMLAATLVVGPAAEEPVVEPEDHNEFFVLHRDSAGKPYFPEGKASYYTRYLAAMKEPSVLADRSPRVKWIIRFTYLRSFHNPLIVRITETNESVAARIVSLERDQNYRPVKIVEDRSFKLDDQQSRMAAGLAVDKPFWKPLTEVEEAITSMGMDGSRWIFEIHDSEGYRMVDVWSPDAIAKLELKGVRDFQTYKKIGVQLLKMGGILPPKDQRY